MKKWNWGAFTFNIFWGIGNKTYLPLLCLIPFFNLGWIFVCGVKGDEWAWRDGHYTDVATFKQVQATWNRAGFVSFIINVSILGLYLIFAIFAVIIGIAAASSDY
ncbi:ribonuclease G [Furfurilactobacillus entadae]|uniref:ribonuclease G n=1 Tax=Furfurilactobacillus entadae TaxID=2922307 RepID=UPI0038B2B8DF